MLTFSIIQAG